MEPVAFWKNDYPDMRNVVTREQQMNEAGYGGNYKLSSEPASLGKLFHSPRKSV